MHAARCGGESAERRSRQVFRQSRRVPWSQRYVRRRTVATAQAGRAAQPTTATMSPPAIARCSSSTTRATAWPPRSDRATSTALTGGRELSSPSLTGPGPGADGRAPSRSGLCAPGPVRGPGAADRVQPRQSAASAGPAVQFVAVDLATALVPRQRSGASITNGPTGFVRRHVIRHQPRREENMVHIENPG